MRYGRSPFLDEYVEAGESVVLLPDGLVTALSPLATAVLQDLSLAALSLEEVAERLVARFGAPPGDNLGVQTTRAVLETLISHRLIESAES